MLTSVTCRSRKSKLQDDDYPECDVETIDGRPAYFCERTVNGEKQKFGIHFWGGKSFTCGEYQGDLRKGPNYELSLDGPNEQQSLCAIYDNGAVEGSISWYFFESGSMEIGTKTVRGKVAIDQKTSFLTAVCREVNRLRAVGVTFRKQMH